MRYYIIDEISSQDIQRIRHYLEQKTDRSSIEDLYWLELAPSLLCGIQLEHQHCQPYGVAIEVGGHCVKFELLIRSRMSHNCDCSRYAQLAQREFIVAFSERLIRDLGLLT